MLYRSCCFLVVDREQLPAANREAEFAALPYDMAPSRMTLLNSSSGGGNG